MLDELFSYYMLVSGQKSTKWFWRKQFSILKRMQWEFGGHSSGCWGHLGIALCRVPYSTLSIPTLGTLTVGAPIKYSMKQNIQMLAYPGGLADEWRSLARAYLTSLWCHPCCSLLGSILGTHTTEHTCGQLLKSTATSVHQGRVAVTTTDHPLLPWCQFMSLWGSLSFCEASRKH